MLPLLEELERLLVLVEMVAMDQHQRSLAYRSPMQVVVVVVRSHSPEVVALVAVVLEVCPQDRQGLLAPQILAVVVVVALQLQLLVITVEMAVPVLSLFLHLLLHLLQLARLP